MNQVTTRIQRERRALDPMGWLLTALALGSFANGVWMLLEPAHWYHHLPAGVPDTGPLNVHFVRDIGCAFLTIAAAFALAARRAEWRAPLVSVAAFFYVAHGALHVHDTLRGLVGPEHWWLDAWGVYVPALVIPYLAIRLARQPVASLRSETRGLVSEPIHR